MQQILEKLNKKIFDYIESLKLNYNKKIRIYNIYLKFINEKYKTYSSIKYYNKKEAVTYLKNDANNFKKRIDLLIKTNENAFEYIRFINNNKYNFNINTLTYNDKKIYEWIMSPSFDIYVESLISNKHNYMEICQKLHYLAVKFGYTKDLEKSTDKTKVNYNDASVPDAIKNAIKGVEK